MHDTLFSMMKSWCSPDSSVEPTSKLLDWVARRKAETAVAVRKIPLEQCAPWFYDAKEGCIRNESRSFFTIRGFRGRDFEQPIILQPEIGYLGILCREFGGVMHFLMQAKIEPGNVNCVQISPTTQATKSNFTRKHGGKKPPYLDYFLNAARYEIVVDQIQSEQSSRFYKKRNRNIILRVEEDIPLLPSHRWMTLGQIKRFMREDNLVNMDTRTVLSCIPFSKLILTPPREREELSGLFTDKPLFRSVFEGPAENPLPRVYQYINNAKMFAEGGPELVSLDKLEDWEMRDGELVCRHPYPFKVVFCDIAIEGREVRRWTQPLFEANGVATFGLICCEKDGRLQFVVRATPEVGCFDGLELGPTVQQEAVSRRREDGMTRLFWERLARGQGVMFDHLLSEEGGRFYHEQNRNVLLRVRAEDLPPLPEDCFLLDHRTLNELVQVNNTLNIQLRNLLSLLEA